MSTTIHNIAPPAKPESQAEKRAELLDEEKRRHRNQRLRKAGDDAPTGSARDTRSARDHYEAHRETFGNVVDGDRDGDQKAETLSLRRRKRPAPAPSVNEWTVIAPTIAAALTASAP